MRPAVAMVAAVAFVLPGWVLAGPKPPPWIVWQTDSTATQSRTVSGLRFEMATVVGANGQRTPVLAVSDGIRRSHQIVGEAGHATSTNAAFSVARLDRNRDQPIVLFRSYSGGAHCCHVYRAAYQDTGGAWTVRDLGYWHSSYAPQLRDVDRDGRLELVGRDQRFAYAFTSHAESVAPAQVWELVEGQLVDVSSHRRYRRVFERELNGLRSHCLRERARGYCASYAATAARLGRLSEAGQVLDQAFPPRSGDRESAPILQASPEGPFRKQFSTFREAVTWYLGELGYPSRQAEGATS